MPRPARAITAEDQWRAYQCDLLEEIRDLLREMLMQLKPQVVNVSIGAEPPATGTTNAAPDQTVEVKIKEATRPRPARGAKGGGIRGKDV